MFEIQNRKEYKSNFVIVSRAERKRFQSVAKVMKKKWRPCGLILEYVGCWISTMKIGRRWKRGKITNFVFVENEIQCTPCIYFDCISKLNLELLLFKCENLKVMLQKFHFRSYILACSLKSRYYFQIMRF